MDPSIKWRLFGCSKRFTISRIRFTSSISGVALDSSPELLLDRSSISKCISCPLLHTSDVVPGSTSWYIVHWI